MATYCSVSDVKTTTRNEELKAESTSVITALIEQAELLIDQYAGFINTPSDQTRKFPTIDESAISNNVKYATIYQVEYMFERFGDLDHLISEEGERTVKNEDLISMRAKVLLKDYRTIVGRPFTYPISQDVILD